MTGTQVTTLASDPKADRTTTTALSGGAPIARTRESLRRFGKEALPILA